MLDLQKSLHSKYMGLLTDAIKGVQGSSDMDIQNWVAGARILSDSVAILMSLACLEAILKKSEVEEPEITTLLCAGVEACRTKDARDPSVSAGNDFSRSQRLRDDQADPVLIDLGASESSEAEAKGSKEMNPTGSVKREPSIMVPILYSDEAPFSHTTPLPRENPTSPPRAPPSGRPFIHHAWSPRPTPQGLRREYAFNHKSHFELAWVPEFGNVVPRTVEEALPAHYSQGTTGAVGPLKVLASAPVSMSSSGRVQGECDEVKRGDEGDSPLERRTRSKASNADVNPVIPLVNSDPSQGVNSQLRRDRSTAPAPEPIISPSKPQKRKRNRDAGGDNDGDSRSTRRTRSKPNNA